MIILTIKYMFKALFGSIKSTTTLSNKTTQNQKLDPHETMAKLVDQMENVEKRVKITEVKMKQLHEEALQKKKANDQRGALFALKRKKMLERELAKLDGQMALLESQRLMLETTVSDQSVFQVLSHAQVAVENLTAKLTIEDLEDIKDKMEE